MMSQNRQGVKDRMAAEHDYEVNLKAELEVMGLHEKLDGLREQQWAELIELQRRQLALLERIVAERGRDAGSARGRMKRRRRARPARARQGRRRVPGGP